MKLESKHIMPYYHFGLKVNFNRNNGMFKSDNVNILNTAICYSDALKTPFFLYKDVSYGIYDCTPMLRPLSSITEEEGIELCKLLTKGKDCEFKEIRPVNFTERVVLGFDEVGSLFFYYEDKGNKDCSLELNMEDEAFTITVSRGSYPNCNDLNHIDLMDWMYKNHFDIHGLIPANLAIDITL